MYTTRAQVQAAIQNVTYTRGTTNTPDALMHTRTVMFGPQSGTRNVSKVAILITDGGSDNKANTQKEALLLKNSGVTLIVIGTGNWLDMKEINNTASYPYTSNAIVVHDYNNLNTITDQLVGMICNNVNDCSGAPCQHSGTCVDGFGFYTCRNCATGFSGKSCEVTCRVPADVVVAVDASSSITAENFQRELDFVRELAFGLNINTDSRMGMIVFSDQATVQFNLNANNNILDILNAISTIQMGGITNIGQAIVVARDQMFTDAAGARPNVPRVLVIITNGQSLNITNTVAESMSARANKITILVVAVGVDVSRAELEGIASYPTDKNIFNVSDFTQLSSISSAVIQSQCNSVDDCSPTPCLNGGQCTDLINGYICTCSDTNTGKTCQRGGNGLADMVIAIDTSGSIRLERFTYIRQYIAQLLDDLEISPNKTKVAVVVYADDSQEVLSLNSFTNKQDIIWTTNNIVFSGGKTNTASALQMIQDKVFTQGAGDRSNARNIVWLFTDGNSNLNQENTIPQAVSLRISGAYVITISIGSDVNRYELAGIASEPHNETVFIVGSYRDLPTIVDSVINSVTNDVNYCASRPCMNGGECINDVKRPVCRCTMDWAGLFCDRRCPKQIDLAFVLDTSGSGNFAEVLAVNIELVREIVVDLPTSSSQVLVSLITFGNGANISFYLNTFSSGDDILDALSFRPSIGKTQLDVALGYLPDVIFKDGNGRGVRPTSRKVAIVITDSDSPSDYSTVVSQATRAKAQNIELFAVVVGSGPDPREFQSIVTNSTNLWQIAGAADVTKTADAILMNLCSV